MRPASQVYRQTVPDPPCRERGSVREASHCRWALTPSEWGQLKKNEHARLVSLCVSVSLPCRSVLFLAQYPHQVVR